MRGALTLRGRLFLLWLFTIAVCLALAYVMRSVYQLGTEAQTEKALALASQACAKLKTEYVRATKPIPSGSDIVLMGALLNVVLDDAPGIEGGFWDDGRGFVAYAFPTHQGSEPKTDVPSTERGRIEALVRSSLGGDAPRVDLQPGSRETVVMVACPIRAQAMQLGAWTMTRVPVAPGKAYGEVAWGLGLLLAFAIGSGLWLGYSFYRWTSHFGQMERALQDARAEGASSIPETGDAELDRVVGALNGFRGRLAAAQTQAAELRSSLEREERYAALGRMAASVAHEVRNPIAAMRLKVENALLDPERRDAALAFVLREIDRLENTVKALLSRAEPVRVQPRTVDVAAWLQDRVAAFAERSASKEIAISTAVHAGSWRFDPVAVGRAIDNLIDNALDHTPRGGAVRIEATASESPLVLILTVADSGPGVGGEIRQRLFEPFVSGRPDGIGLGLALAREVLRAHGGEIRHIPGQPGAVFQMEIPWRES